VLNLDANQVAPVMQNGPTISSSLEHHPPVSGVRSQQGFRTSADTAPLAHLCASMNPPHRAAMQATLAERWAPRLINLTAYMCEGGTEGAGYDDPPSVALLLDLLLAALDFILGMQLDLDAFQREGKGGVSMACETPGPAGQSPFEEFVRPAITGCYIQLSLTAAQWEGARGVLRQPLLQQGMLLRWIKALHLLAPEAASSVLELAAHVLCGPEDDSRDAASEQQPDKALNIKVGLHAWRCVHCMCVAQHPVMRQRCNHLICALGPHTRSLRIPLCAPSNLISVSSTFYRNAQTVMIPSSLQLVHQSSM
jgi:hypothetical protein